MAEEQYVLKSEAMRVVQRNDKGIVTYRKRYKRGAVVDVSYIDPAHVEALIRTGRLGLADDADAPEEATETPEATEGSGDTTGDAGDGTESEDDEDEEPEDFESYDYPTLQRLAKERTGDGSGGKQDLIDRLTAHAAE